MDSNTGLKRAAAAATRELGRGRQIGGQSVELRHRADAIEGLNPLRQLFLG
jgi:hypothetical protein